MRTIYWDSEGPSVRMIDQRLLPSHLDFLSLHTPEAVAAAIRDMAIRGAPAIGAAAAFGLALAAQKSSASDSEQLIQDLRKAADLLNASRPTAANLKWALDRLFRRIRGRESEDLEYIRQALLEEAQKLADEDVEINQRIGKHGAQLLSDGDQVIHHCNTGALATVDYGTALGVIRTAHEQGKKLHVFVDETRPRLQGARLTAWELDQSKIPYEIITDNAAGYFLQSGQIAAVLVGADRVAGNGDVANKIGTYMLALSAADNQVPFYVAVPTSTIDLDLPSGDRIPIEERNEDEVLNIEKNGMPIAPKGSHARNPAFDITPHRLVKAFITEVGVLKPPYERTLRKAVEEAVPS